MKTKETQKDIDRKLYLLGRMDVITDLMRELNRKKDILKEENAMIFLEMILKEQSKVLNIISNLKKEVKDLELEK